MGHELGGYHARVTTTGSDAARMAEDERFRALIQDSADVIAVLDLNGCISFLSPSSEQLFGAKIDLATAGEAISFVHPADRDRIAQEFGALLDESAAVLRSDVRMRRADGAVRFMEINARNLLHNPHVAGIVCSLRDVTERRHVEDQLRDTAQQLERVLNHSRDAIVVIGATGAIEWVSPAVTDLLGFQPHELIGQESFGFAHPDDLNVALSRAAAALIADVYGEPLVMRMRHQDDSWIPCEAAAGAVLADDGTIESVVVNLHDARARLIAEAEVTATNDRFRALVEHSGAVAEIIDAEGSILWISDNVFELLGYRPEEMIGQLAATFAHPDDLIASLGITSEIGRALGASATFDARIRHKNGSWRWMDLTFTNRLDDPAINGVIGNFRDVTDRHIAEQALRSSEKLFRSVAQSSPTGIFQKDAQRNCVYVNERWQEITGYTFEQAMGSGWRRIVHPDDRGPLGVDEPNQPVGTVAVTAEFRVVRPDGTIRWVAVSTAPMIDDLGSVIGTVGTLEDVSDRIDAERNNQRFIDIFEATSDLVAITDPDGELLSVNRAAREFLNLEFGQSLHGLNLLARLPSGHAHETTEMIAATLFDDGSWSGELLLVRDDGRPVPLLAQLLVHRDSEGRPEFLSAVLRDISERKQFESALHYQATHDPLTGLPNRALLLDRLADALARAKHTGLRVALLFIDLDHFKVVNDSLGHALGDKLLISIADRLTTAMRPGDVIARFGGDEFVLLCENLHGQPDAVAIAERVLAAVSGPFAIDDTELFVGMSIGIAFPADADAEPANLIRDADAAMYRAKEKGRARWVVFDNAMRLHAVDRLDVENALRRAIDRHELRVHYQPIVRLQPTGDGDPSDASPADWGGGVTAWIEGVEALLRWEHPDRGLLLPNEFISIAEETGLIVDFGAWVLEQACRQVTRWQASIPGLPPLKLSVNLSGRQLSHPTLVQDVASVLLETGIDAAHVEFEITESVLMDDVELSEETLGELKELGVKLSVDDFGTGYSSLSYLRRFPVDVLKVDRSFVDGVDTDPSDSAIVTAIITLAHSLGMTAVAEGVETVAQLDELRRLGCDLGQGYLFARPASGDAVAELLERWHLGLGVPP